MVQAQTPMRMYGSCAAMTDVFQQVIRAIYAAFKPGTALRAYYPHRWQRNLLTLSQGLGGSPAICASHQAAVLWSYDCHANGGLYHSYHQGCVAKMVDITSRYCKSTGPELSCLYVNKLSALLHQSQIPCAGRSFFQRIHVTLTVTPIP